MLVNRSADQCGDSRTRAQEILYNCGGLQSVLARAEMAEAVCLLWLHYPVDRFLVRRYAMKTTEELIDYLML